MPGINPGVRLLNNSRYPGIAQDYARTFGAMKALSPDIFLASHASQFGMHRKYRPGDAYEPDRFVDPQGYRVAIAGLEKAYLNQLARETSPPRLINPLLNSSKITSSIFEPVSISGQCGANSIIGSAGAFGTCSRRYGFSLAT
jgi:hypothetical protein